MQDCKPVCTPLALSIKLDEVINSEDDEETVYPYRNLVGGLMYLAMGTQSDIAHTVSFLSQFNSKFNKIHWAAAKRVLRYLKRTSNLSLIFEKTRVSIHGYVDSDLAGSIIDHRSYFSTIYISTV